MPAGTGSTQGLTWARWVPGMALLLGSLVWGGCVIAAPAARPPGTPMKTSCPDSIELPTVEECHEEAARIDDELLMSCIRRQCSGITVTCSEWSRQKCREQSLRYSSAVLAFTVVPRSGAPYRFYPVKETHWCEDPASRECITKVVIHELAHSCGWNHRQGHGVPGNDSDREPIPECACVDEKDTRTSCE